jgi:hypothetical protein
MITFMTVWTWLSAERFPLVLAGHDEKLSLPIGSETRSPPRVFPPETTCQCALRYEGAEGLSSRSAHAKAAASASASPNRSTAKRIASFFSNSQTYG